nr:adenylyltransferase/cytidyltransferase family protein [Bacillus sp. REN10]
MKHPISHLCIHPDPCVLALGFFDGVHAGHQRLLEKAKQIAKQHQLTFSVMTFFPHPKEVLSPDREPMTYLTPLSVKEARFKELGVDQLFVVEFTPEFARLSAEDFVEQYIQALNCKHVVAGFDYHYGAKGSGNMKTLSKSGSEIFTVTTMPKVEHEGEKVSSTAIRHLLANGLVTAIPKLLGDFYEVQGEVKKRSLFYKSHQFLKVVVDKSYRMPKLGVYHIQIELDGYVYEGICQQMTVSDSHTSLLIQLKHCFVDTQNKKVRIKWIESWYEQTNEAYGISEYTYKDEWVI